ncbi:MAG TPA: succinate dehydrogenase, cytochrome b556 subunit [Gammaproteobacteria bacterium]
MTTSNKPAAGGYQTERPRFDLPLSPHLSVYRWQITMTLSILHRASGIALSVGSIVLAWWLASVAIGGETYEWTAGIITHPVGIAFLFGWSVVFFYHLANGIRHLLWDAGVGFEIPQFYASGWTVLVFVVVATAGTWWFAWSAMGGTA